MDNIIWSIGHQLKIKDIVKAKNCHLFDSKGNKYIDFESGVWCTSVGHCNPVINNVIKAQIDKISHSGFCYANPNLEKAAQKILEITGLKGGKCEFICSGSEAVEYGMRVAKTLVERPMTLTFADSFFGSYGEATKREGSNWHIHNWLKCSCHSDTGCIGECEEFRSIPFEKIGIFLFEPGSSSGLVRFPSQQLIKKIEKQLKANGGLIHVNEITTGIGRTGKWFGFQHYDIQPEIVAIGKGVGNGYPVSITAISEVVAKRLAKIDYLYSQSHQNDPLGATVAEAVIDTIVEQNLLERATELGAKIKSQLNELKQKHKIIKAIRGRGLMLAIELTQQAELVHQKLLKNGFILVKRSGVEVLRIDPALTIEEADIKKFLTIFEQIIIQIEKYRK